MMVWMYIQITIPLCGQFIGQRYQLATFSIISEFYRGAHGGFSTDYVNVDLARQKEITLTDLVDESAIKGGLREVLWTRYGEYLNDKETESFIEEKDFRVSPNFRIEAEAVVFVYPLYGSSVWVWRS